MPNKPKYMTGTCFDRLELLGVCERRNDI